MREVSDFKVKYRFYSESEGGRKSLPSQGYRSDWSYDGDDIQKDGIYMIWPIFLDNDGNRLKKDIPANLEGEAEMQIIVPEMIEVVHRDKVAVNVKGYFMEGSRRVAEATIIEVLGINEEKT